MLLLYSKHEDVVIDFALKAAKSASLHRAVYSLSFSPSKEISDGVRDLSRKSTANHPFCALFPSDLVIGGVVTWPLRIARLLEASSMG